MTNRDSRDDPFVTNPSIRAGISRISHTTGQDSRKFDTYLRDIIL